MDFVCSKECSLFLLVSSTAATEVSLTIHQPVNGSEKILGANRSSDDKAAAVGLLNDIIPIT